MYEQQEEESVRVRTPRGKEVLGIVESTLGAAKLRVRCQDNKIRICRIPGRLKRKMWINEKDVVIVEPWDIQGDERGDILWKYTKAQAGWLERRGLLTL